jgi:hypothetical protein
MWFGRGFAAEHCEGLTAQAAWRGIERSQKRTRTALLARQDGLAAIDVRQGTPSGGNPIRGVAIAPELAQNRPAHIG